MPEAPSDSPETGIEENPQTPEPVQEPAPEPAKADPVDQLPTDHPLVKALAAQKAQIKELKAKAARLDEIEESQKTELQKAIERAEAAEGAMGALKAAEQQREWKAAAAKKYGVPVEALRGFDEEEIDEHAQALKALLPEPRKPGAVPGEGRTVPTGSGDPAQQFAEIIRNARRG